jgi:hypothetical protein
MFYFAYSTKTNMHSLDMFLSRESWPAVFAMSDLPSLLKLKAVAHSPFIDELCEAITSRRVEMYEWLYRDAVLDPLCRPPKASPCWMTQHASMEARLKTIMPGGDTFLTNRQVAKILCAKSTVSEKEKNRVRTVVVEEVKKMQNEMRSKAIWFYVHQASLRTPLYHHHKGALKEVRNLSDLVDQLPSFIRDTCSCNIVVCRHHCKYDSTSASSVANKGQWIRFVWTCQFHCPKCASDKQLYARAQKLQKAALAEKARSRYRYIHYKTSLRETFKKKVAARKETLRRDKIRCKAIIEKTSKEMAQLRAKLDNAAVPKKRRVKKV